MGIAACYRRLGNVDLRHIKHRDRRPARIENLTLFQYRSRPLDEPEPEPGLARHAAALEPHGAPTATEHARSERPLLGAVGRRHVAQVDVDQRQAGPRPLDLDDAVAAAIDAPGSAYREVVLPLDLYSF